MAEGVDQSRLVDTWRLLVESSRFCRHCRQNREGKETCPFSYSLIVESGAAAAGETGSCFITLIIHQRAKGTQRRVPGAAMSEARRQDRSGSKTGRALAGTRQGVRHDIGACVMISVDRCSVSISHC